MITVYIWNTAKRTGHASMQAGQEYISFHPDAEKNTSLSEIIQHTWKDKETNFDEDLGNREYSLAKTIRIRNADESVISGMWIHLLNYFREHPDRGYNFLRMNCSTVVGKLLSAYKDHELVVDNISGDIWEKMFQGPEHHHTLIQQHPPRGNRIIEIINDAIDSAAPMIAHRKFTGKRFQDLFIAGVMILSLTRHAAIWTPGDVEEIAESLRHELDGN